MDSQGIIWEKQVSQTQISYPGTPVFRPGIPYSVTIQTDGGQSSEQDKASKIEFIRLHSSEVATIQAEVNKIEQLNINKQTKALILADFYGTYTLPTSTFNNYVLSSQSLATYHLTSEAIAILETTIKQGQNSAIIERNLADLYWQIGLANLATNHYLKAIELAQIPEQLEEKTLAQFGLGEVYAALGDNNQAKIWYSKAREGYLALGDSARANFVIQLIESLP
ncbi:MAG: tetratricopeptide repeat protein [Microcystis aeruginosa K13-06]|nr:tetratricopeptide repeat protein [Microcystis aeruginosa K13-06]